MGTALRSRSILALANNVASHRNSSQSAALGQALSRLFSSQSTQVPEGTPTTVDATTAVAKAGPGEKVHAASPRTKNDFILPDYSSLSSVDPFFELAGIVDLYHVRDVRVEALETLRFAAGRPEKFGRRTAHIFTNMAKRGDSRLRGLVKTAGLPADGIPGDFTNASLNARVKALGWALDSVIATSLEQMHLKNSYMLDAVVAMTMGRPLHPALRRVQPVECWILENYTAIKDAFYLDDDK